MDFFYAVQTLAFEQIPGIMSRIPYPFDGRATLIYLSSFALVVLLSFVHEAGHILFGYLFKCNPALQFWALGSWTRNIFSPLSVKSDTPKVDALPYWKYGLMVIGGVLFELPACLLICFVGLNMEAGFLSSVLVIGAAFRAFGSFFNLVPFALLQNDGYMLLNRPKPEFQPAE